MNDIEQPDQSNKPRKHLFSPHTDQCVYCGQSAQDDAIENTPCGDDEQELLRVEPETIIPSLQRDPGRPLTFTGRPSCF